MTGNILFRESIQQLKVGESKSVPWDEVIPPDLLGSWLKYFSMLEGLKDFTFPRSVKPDNVDKSVLPGLATFADGNMQAFGTVAYIICSAGKWLYF